MSLWEAILLGIVQGLTEFLPVSSSGHEVLAATLLGHEMPSAQKQAWVVLVHLASALAIAVFFAWEWLQAGARKRRRIATEKATPIDQSGESAVAAPEPAMSPTWLPSIRWGWFLAAGTVPAGLVYLAFRDFFDDHAFQYPQLVAVALIVNAGILLFVDRLRPNGTRRVRDTDPRSRAGWMLLLIGVAQAFAMIPGISRSGSTICAGLLLGLQREEAVRFSFALGFVAILAATGKTIVEGTGLSALTADLGVGPLIAGFTASFIASLGALMLLLALVRRVRLWWFSAYCFTVAVVALVWLSL